MAPQDHRDYPLTRAPADKGTLSLDRRVVAIAPALAVGIPGGTGSAASALPGVTDAFAQCKQMAMDLFQENLPAILALLAFYLAVRFAPALISWFRHRNDPKQLGHL